MGMPLSIFAIPQVVNLVVPETTGPGPRIRMNYPVNRTDFRLVRGVTNRVEVFVRDIDRQPFPLPSGARLDMAITDLRGENKLLLRRALTLTDASLGLWRLTVEPSILDRWEDGMLRFTTLMVEGDGTETVLWTDRDYSPYGFLRVSEPPVPEPAPSANLDPVDFLLRDGWLYSSILRGAANLGVDDAAHTFAFDLDGFAGSILIEATLEMQPSQDDSIWFEIGSLSFAPLTPETSVVPFSFAIPVQWVRVRFRAELGSVRGIEYRN